jgi:hypothetical protein
MQKFITSPPKKTRLSRFFSMFLKKILNNLAATEKEGVNIANTEYAGFVY